MSANRATRAVALLVVAAVAGVGIGLLVHGLSSGGSAAGAGAKSTEVQGQAVWPAGVRRGPAITGLRDSTGRRFSLAALRGHPVVVLFLDSRCHQECPLEGHALAAGMRQVPPAQRPQVVVVSIDPWEDTPGSVRRAMRRFGLDGSRWHWLLGSPARLLPVWDAYGIEVRRAAGDIEHTPALYLLDAAGYERAGIVYPFLPSWIGNDLEVLAAESG